MIQIETGQGKVPLLLLVTIWSISAMISLPGLAISPILGDMDKIFPHSTHLEIQMLTSLPSLLIIPFVLLSGKLSVSKNKIRLLYMGLGLFFVSGIICIFARSILLLIIISCVLGIGAGLIIPLSTGLIADYFKDKYRVKYLGISSSISNLTLVLATSLTGWLATINYHYPFLVYTIPIVSILLARYLTRYPAPQSIVVKEAQPQMQIGTFTIQGVDIKKLIRIIILYFFATYAALVITFNLPFLLQHYNMSSFASGFMISMFFLAIMLPGLFITRIIKYFKRNTILYALSMMFIGLILIYTVSIDGLVLTGCIITGLGYGIIQPLMYDKAVDCAIPAKSTLSLALLMSANYLAILICPFILTGIVNLFDAKSASFPFLINAVLTFIAIIICYKYKDKSFAFGLNEKYYK